MQSLEPCSPISLSSNDFINFHDIIVLREKNHDRLSSTYTDPRNSFKTRYLIDCFTVVDVQQPTLSTIPSRPATYFLDPTRLLKEVLPLYTSNLDINYRPSAYLTFLFAIIRQL